MGRNEYENGIRNYTISYDINASADAYNFVRHRKEKAHSEE